MAERRIESDVAIPADRLLHARLGHSAKVSSLSDLEYRVWTTYVVATDDFGVMRADVVAFQAAHDALSTRPAGEIAKCVERLVETGLVAAFEHQGARYLYQWDWQDFQRVRFPARTLHPLPASAEVSARTHHLWSVHPGGARVPALPRSSDTASAQLRKLFRRTSGEPAHEAGAAAASLPHNFGSSAALRAKPHETASDRNFSRTAEVCRIARALPAAAARHGGGPLGDVRAPSGGEAPGAERAGGRAGLGDGLHAADACELYEARHDGGWRTVGTSNNTSSEVGAFMADPARPPTSGPRSASTAGARLAAGGPRRVTRGGAGNLPGRDGPRRPWSGRDDGPHVRPQGEDGRRGWRPRQRERSGHGHVTTDGGSGVRSRCGRWRCGTRTGDGSMGAFAAWHRPTGAARLGEAEACEHTTTRKQIMTLEKADPRRRHFGGTGGASAPAVAAFTDDATGGVALALAQGEAVNRSTASPGWR